MLENDFPIGHFEHLRQVLNCVWTLRNCIQDHVSSETNFNLLKDKSTLCDHQNGVVLHFIQCALPLALLLVCILADECDLSIFGLEVGF